MSHLPILEGKEIISALSKQGYRIVRQRGSHIRLVCHGRNSVTVPNHSWTRFTKKNIERYRFNNRRI